MQKQHISVLKLCNIKLLPELQVRVQLHDQTIDDYAEDMANGDKFPPVEVVRVGQEFVLADGFHRHHAAVKADIATIKAHVTTGNMATALKIALESNRNRALRMTNLDKNRAVELALKQWGDFSDNKIASMVGVSQPFVGKVRSQVITVITSTRIGADGKHYPMPPSRPVFWPDETKETIAAKSGQERSDLYCLIAILGHEAGFAERMEQLLDDPLLSEFKQLREAA